MIGEGRGRGFEVGAFHSRTKEGKPRGLPSFVLRRHALFFYCTRNVSVSTEFAVSEV
jgi:hypothetical protein